jgi:hypothetical protein
MHRVVPVVELAKRSSQHSFHIVWQKDNGHFADQWLHIAEFVFGFPLYFAVDAVWPDFYYTPIDAGKWTWLGIQGLCIAIYVIGVMCAYGGIKHASHVLASARAR